jgi:ribosomal protein S18 acetylase RimI-like enzyme
MQPQLQKLIQATENYASNFRTANSLAADYIKTALYEQDIAFISALKAENFELHRTYWRLRIDHRDVINNYEAPANIKIVDFVKSDMSMRDMHDLSSAIFQDHYDFSPMNFADWEVERNSGVNSSTLWRIALMNNQPVGYCWRSRRFESEGFSYVSSIGVLREFRGQGIAKALLMDAFAEASTAELEGTLLHCDASNPNGATALYENVGMRVDRVYPAYRKLI